jgi:membrane protease YdiL (CAAX protease family)
VIVKRTLGSAGRIPQSRSWWRSRPSEPRPGLGVVTAVAAALAAYSIAAATVLDGAGRVGTALLLVAGLTVIARRAGIGLTEIGFTNVREGLRWGLAFGVPLAVAIVLLSLVRLPEDPFASGPYGQMSVWEVLFRAAIRIPIGTALFEEYLFRGLLLALLLRRSTPVQALVVSSLLFGAWHIPLALTNADAGGPLHHASVILPVTFAVTFAAGALLAWLRIRSGSLLAPFLVHALVNSTALVAAHLAMGGRGAG